MHFELDLSSPVLLIIILLLLLLIFSILELYFLAVLVLLYIHGLLFLDFSFVSVELTIISSSEEGVHDTDSLDEMELLDFK